MGVAAAISSAEGGEMTEPETDLPSQPPAKRWPRFFARIFDCLWETLLVSEILLALGSYSAEFVVWLSQPFNRHAFGAICLLLAMFIDSTVYRALGNTPGKAFIGLKVTTSRGAQPTFGEYLTRNINLWAAGLGLGFPIFNLITMAYQARRLGKGQQASYDESSGNRVRATPIGTLRWMAFLLVFFTLYVAYHFDTLEHLIEGYRKAARAH
jgi:uncharacterized RDD family membrane protein YckC